MCKYITTEEYFVQTMCTCVVFLCGIVCLVNFSSRLPKHQAYCSYHTESHTDPAGNPNLSSRVHGSSVPDEMFQAVDDVEDEREAEKAFDRQSSGIWQSSEPLDETRGIEVPSHEWCSQIRRSEYVYRRRDDDGRIPHYGTRYPVDLWLVYG